MSGHYPSSGHQGGRTHAAARVPLSLLTLKSAILNRRKVTSERFHQPSAWLRLIVLGVLLVDLAILTFANTQFGRNISGYWPGMGFVFGGLLIGIIIMRLARPLLYLDWIAVAVLKIVLGFMLARDPLQTALPAFLLFSFAFTILGVLKIWIGISFPFGRAAASLTAGGLVSLFIVAGLVVDRVAELGIGADTILAIDLTIAGLSIIGFGLALRPPPGTTS
ncbi:hypothetical protein ACFFP0_07600 [Rhizobium puerariae]|uniref:Uncharacterized protein n=1 Tax=Rhizobium puerariae TaxID=1585791 RepID=A0ABV6ADL0_9HYPH